MTDPQTAEILAMLASGLFAEPAAGWAGIMSGGDPGAVERTRERFTYKPKGKQAKTTLAAAGKLLEPVGAAYGKGMDWAGDKTLDVTGSPALATLVRRAPEFALTLAGAAPGVKSATGLARQLPEGAMKTGLLADIGPAIESTVPGLGAPGAAAIKWTPDQIKQFVDRATRGKGATVDAETGLGLKRGDRLPPGYMVASRAPGINNKRFENIAPTIDRERVSEYLSDPKVRGALEQPGAALGAWPQDGKWYLDVSHNVPKRQRAANEVITTGEKASYNTLARARVKGDQFLTAPYVSDPFPEFNAERAFRSGLLGPTQEVTAPAAIITKKKNPSPTRGNPTPEEVVRRAEQQVAPEDPLLQQLFGINRQGVDEATLQAQHANSGTRLYTPSRPPEHAQKVWTPTNKLWVGDVLDRAGASDKLAGTYGWYYTDPYERLYRELLGDAEGARRFKIDNSFGSALSPMSAVEPEISRSSIAAMFDKQGRLPDFLNAANIPEGYGHIAHNSAHGKAIKRYIDTGSVFSGNLKDAVKTNVYNASRLPSREANYVWPTGDAHFVRGVGLDKLRPWTKDKDSGLLVPDRSSIRATEYMPVAEGFNDVAAQRGMMGSPAQALMWNALAPMTGVKSAIGAPYLELVARRAAVAAKRQGTDSKTALIRHILGKDYLGKIDPELLAVMGGSGLLAAGGSYALRE